MANKAQNLKPRTDSRNVGKRRWLSCGGEFRRGVNPLKDRLKLDNCMTRAMWVVMKLVRVASNRHLRNWEAPDALAQEIIPSGELNEPWAKLRRGDTEDTGKRPAFFYTHI